MKPDKFCKKVQHQLLKLEKIAERDPEIYAHLKAFHQLLEDGVNQFGPELTNMGVNIKPLSGGLPKPDSV